MAHLTLKLTFWRWMILRIWRFKGLGFRVTRASPLNLTSSFELEIWPTPPFSHVVNPMVQKSALKVSPFARYNNSDFFWVVWLSSFWGFKKFWKKLPPYLWILWIQWWCWFWQISLELNVMNGLKVAFRVANFWRVKKLEDWSVPTPLFWMVVNTMK